MKIAVKLPENDILHQVSQALYVSLDYLVSEELNNRADFTDFMVEQLAEQLDAIAVERPDHIVFTAHNYDLVCSARKVLEDHVAIDPEISLHLQSLQEFLELQDIKNTF
jgi:hypothetical protein